MTDGSGSVAAAGQQIAGTAADKTGQVTQQAGQQAKAVAGSAVEQARQVSGQAAARAGDLLGQTKDQARRQAETQTRQAAQSLGRLRDQGQALAAGRPEAAGSLPDLAEQVVARLDQVVERIDSGGFDGIVNDVQRFARRRPALFLLGAAGLGLAVGRLIRAGAVPHATGQETDSPPDSRPAPPAPPTDLYPAEPLTAPPPPTSVPPVAPTELGGL
jgi:hypothetical protein